MKLAILSGVATLIFSVLPGRADISFLYMMDPNGNPADTVEGDLTFASTGNVFPTSVTITEAPSYLGIPSLPYTVAFTKVLSDAVTVTTPTNATGFTVTSSSVSTTYDIAFEDASGNGIAFNYYYTAGQTGPGYDGVLYNGNQDIGTLGSGGITFTALPKPRTWSLWLLSGAALLVAVRKIRAFRVKLPADARD